MIENYGVKKVEYLAYNISLYLNSIVYTLGILSNEAHAKKGESQTPIGMWHTPNHRKDFWVQELSLQVIQIVWNRYLKPLFQNIQGQHLVKCYVDIGMHSRVLLWVPWTVMQGV